MEWLDASVVWWHWVTLGLLLALGEMLLPSFFLLLVGVSAICVGLLLLAVDMSFTTQLLLWGGLSVLDVVAWFVFVMPRIPDRTRSGMALEALLGQIGTLNEANPTTGRGRLRFPAPIVGSDEWNCILAQPMKVGERVRVLRISGNDLVVAPLDGPLEAPGAPSVAD